MFPRLADLWLMPHRPLFLAMALWAIIAILWWQSGMAPGLGAFWHGHEMLAGFGGAALAAYLLTALPHWTGTPGPSGRMLRAICACWVLQRLAMAGAGVLPPALLALPGLGFFGLLAGTMLQAMRRARCWARLASVLLVAAMGIGDALAILAAWSGWHRPDSAILLQTMVLGFALLIASIGGRMVPAFADSWRRACAISLPTPNPVPGRLGLALIWLALGLTLAGAAGASGMALVAAGLAQIWQLAGWRGWQTRAEPLLAMLNAAWLWLALGLILAGLSRLVPAALPMGDLLHALTMGAMGNMILAVAARAAARRDDGGRLCVGPTLIAAAVLLWGAPWLRLAVALWPGAGAGLNALAALLWAGGWGLFLRAFLPTLSGPGRRPVFSGSRTG